MADNRRKVLMHQETADRALFRFSPPVTVTGVAREGSTIIDKVAVRLCRSRAWAALWTNCCLHFAHARAAHPVRIPKRIYITSRSTRSNQGNQYSRGRNPDETPSPSDYVGTGNLQAHHPVTKGTHIGVPNDRTGTTLVRMWSRRGCRDPRRPGSSRATAVCSWSRAVAHSDPLPMSAEWTPATRTCKVRIPPARSNCLERFDRPGPSCS